MRPEKLGTSWVLGGAALALVLGVLGGLWTSSGLEKSLPASSVPATVAYTAFSHRKHTALGIACGACHFQAYVEAWAGLPAVELCRLCHRSVEAPPASWEPATRLSGHVFFSHRRHTVSGGVSCERCHGEVQAWDGPPAEPSFPRGMAGMNRCVACHRIVGASTDCLSCHR